MSDNRWFTLVLGMKKRKDSCPCVESAAGLRSTDDSTVHEPIILKLPLAKARFWAASSRQIRLTFMIATITWFSYDAKCLLGGVAGVLSTSQAANRSNLNPTKYFVEDRADVERCNFSSQFQRGPDPAVRLPRLRPGSSSHALPLLNATFRS